MPETINTPSELADKLQDILVRGSLYHNFFYLGKDCHGTRPGGINKLRYGSLPKQLKLFCPNDKCKQGTLWQTGETTVSFFTPRFIHNAEYTCRNCGENTAYYYFIWQEAAQHSLFVKVGQFPPLAIEPTPELAKALGEEDSKLYKKALIDANFSHGLGAIAYFRRVLENKVNDLIDLIAEAARNAHFESDDLAHIEEIKRSHRVEDRIEFASRILPPSLKPGGHDPLQKLFTAASVGLHGESDEQCLAIFNDARFEFEYLLRNLTVGNEEARKYVKRLSTPLKIRATGKRNPEPHAGATGTTGDE